MGWSFNSRTDFFPWETITHSEVGRVGHVSTLCKCVCKTGGWYLLAFALWKPFSERLPPMCVKFHNGEKSAAACVHGFLFPSGENWYWNIQNAASSFRRVLPKLIEDIWGVFPFQKWMLILWRRSPPRQIVHLPHRGDDGTCARNH